MYEVYVARYKDEIVYIGSGVEGRHLHCISGVSHNYDLNRLVILYNEGISPHKLTVEVIHNLDTKEDAVKIERDLIVKMQSSFNKKDLTRKITDEELDYIRKHKKPSFFRLAKEYHSIMSEIESGCSDERMIELRQAAMNILIEDNDLRKYVEVLGWQRLSTLSFSKGVIEKEYNEKYIFIDKKSDMQSFMNLVIGESYTRDSLVILLTKTFNEYSITLEPKVSIIGKMYETKLITLRDGGKVVGGIKILSLK